jgi:phosphoglycerate dehydrogenase-like enzyme
MAGVQGAPGYRYLTTPHPVAGLTSEQVRERAEAVAEQVAKMLAGERP